ncbi:MAG TPA: hypothetical protein VNZ86_16220 [Bacteroidia bacterium]|jgi:hypothetical protein|nr:hypothetical protein [Bacteroidia bacterium]
MRLTGIIFLALLFCSALSFVTEPVWSLAASGKNCGVMEKKTVIYHSKKAMLRAWAELRKADPGLELNPPPVDFRKQMLVACYAGSQCNGLRADSVWIGEGILHIRLLRLSIKAGCHNAALLVTPWVWLKVNRVGWNVLKEQEKLEIRECD